MNWQIYGTPFLASQTKMGQRGLFEFFFYTTNGALFFQPPSAAFSQQPCVAQFVGPAGRQERLGLVRHHWAYRGRC